MEIPVLFIIRYGLFLTEIFVIERCNFVVVDLPKNVVAKLFAERFKLSRRIEIKQNIVDITEVGRNSARQVNWIIALNEFARFNRLNTFDVFKARQLCGVVDDVNYLADSAVKFFAVDVLVERVRVVVATWKIYGGNTKFRRNERNIRERTLRELEAFAGDVRLEIFIRVCW